jgi:hypothetical protein
VDDILIGKGERPVHLLPRYGKPPRSGRRRHRHRQDDLALVMAEGFSRLGVPVSWPT